MSIPKICPVLLLGNPPHMAKCREGGCAWWDQLAGSCYMASGADGIQEVANQIAALTISLEELTSKSQAFGNLQNNGLPGAANTEQAEGGKQGLSDTDSTSNDTKETEEMQV